MVWLQTSVDTNASQLSTFRPNVTHRIQSPPDVAVLLGVESQEFSGTSWLGLACHKSSWNSQQHEWISNSFLIRRLTNQHDRLPFEHTIEIERR